jgi:hypothetical protein
MLDHESHLYFCRQNPNAILRQVDRVNVREVRVLGQFEDHPANKCRRSHDFRHRDTLLNDFENVILAAPSLTRASAPKHRKGSLKVVPLYPREGQSCLGNEHPTKCFVAVRRYLRET